MQPLTEAIMERIPNGVLTYVELACLFGGSPRKLHGLVKRAIAAGEVLHLRRELYCLAPKYQRRPLSPLAVAQRLWGPSYLSVESALAWHGWIPEAVHSITSACQKRSRAFDTPVGVFRFIRVPQRTLLLQVRRVIEDDAGGAIFVAGPLKALADYVYVHQADWTSSEPLVGSLRIDPEQLREIRPADVAELLGNYPSRRVAAFLKGLQRELAKCR